MNARTVWKYELQGTTTVLDLPKGAKVLHVAVQRSVPCIWVEADPDAPRTTCRFFLVGTGHPVPIEGDPEHLGSFLSDAQGTFVFHLYGVRDDR